MFLTLNDVKPYSAHVSHDFAIFSGALIHSRSKGRPWCIPRPAKQPTEPTELTERWKPLSVDHSPWSLIAMEKLPFLVDVWTGVAYFEVMFGIAQRKSPF